MIKRIKRIVLIFGCGLGFGDSYSQLAPAIEWQKCLGGSDWDRAICIQTTTDGGYIAAGFAFSNDSDVTGNHGGCDIWIVKFNSSGSIQWQKCLGGSGFEAPNFIIQTPDNGYLVAAQTDSHDGDVSGNISSGISDDAWLVKLDSLGDIQWQKCLGGTSDDNVRTVILMPGGGYVMVGNTYSNDFDVSGNHGGWDVWVVQVDSAANIQWQKCYGGTGWEAARSICRTDDSGFIFAGEAASVNGDVTGNHGALDYWIVKIDSVGTLQWQSCLGGTDDDYAFDLKLTPDKGCIATGLVNSIDGNVTGNLGLNDEWVVKLDSMGALQWEKCFGGTAGDEGSTIVLTQDGGYIIAGESNSTDGDVTGLHGLSSDMWIIKIDTAGNIKWENCFGGTDLEEGPNFIQQTPDNGYIVSCASNSNDGDVSGNNGGLTDYWIIKLAPDTITSVPNLQSSPSSGRINLQLFPNPSASGGTIQLTISTKHNAPLECEIINIMGEKVFQTELQTSNSKLQTNLDVSFLAKGIYLVRVGDGERWENKKLIIN